jgi:hypothetical protein
MRQSSLLGGNVVMSSEYYSSTAVKFAGWQCRNAAVKFVGLVSVHNCLFYALDFKENFAEFQLLVV